MGSINYSFQCSRNPLLVHQGNYIFRLKGSWSIHHFPLYTRLLSYLRFSLVLVQGYTFHPCTYHSDLLHKLMPHPLCMRGIHFRWLHVLLCKNMYSFIDMAYITKFDLWVMGPHCFVSNLFSMLRNILCFDINLMRA